jgi:hypothetical protein
VCGIFSEPHSTQASAQQYSKKENTTTTDQPKNLRNVEIETNIAANKIKIKINPVQ